MAVPRGLLDRSRKNPDSIRGFRAAARERFADGDASAAAGRRTVAIYLWGYSAEMTLKAAYFAFIGHQEVEAVTFDQLEAARKKGLSLDVHWPKAGRHHNVRAWGDLIIAHRADSQAGGYADPSLGRTLRRYGLVFERLWSETLRYHKNVAYEFEVRQVREAADWLLVHSTEL